MKWQLFQRQQIEQISVKSGIITSLITVNYQRLFLSSLALALHHSIDSPFAFLNGEMNENAINKCSILSDERVKKKAKSKIDNQNFNCNFVLTEELLFLYIHVKQQIENKHWVDRLIREKWCEASDVDDAEKNLNWN